MESLRLALPDTVPLDLACSRCGAEASGWDRVVEDAICPSCEERLAVGEGPALVARTQKHRCTICHGLGTVRFTTFPLHSTRPVVIELCGEHLRALLGRRLGINAFHQLRRQLRDVGISCGEIFLLHEAFYDANGHALQPAAEVF